MRGVPPRPRGGTSGDRTAMLARTRPRPSHRGSYPHRRSGRAAPCRQRARQMARRPWSPPLSSTHRCLAAFAAPPHAWPRVDRCASTSTPLTMPCRSPNSCAWAMSHPPNSKNARSLRTSKCVRRSMLSWPSVHSMTTNSV